MSVEALDTPDIRMPKVDPFEHNVDYLYFESDSEMQLDEQAINTSYSALNRSQSVGEFMMTSADRSALKTHNRWKEKDLQAKQCATRLLARIARNTKIKPKISGFKGSLLN